MVLAGCCVGRAASVLISASDALPFQKILMAVVVLAMQVTIALEAVAAELLQAGALASGVHRPGFCASRVGLHLYESGAPLAMRALVGSRHRPLASISSRSREASILWG